MSGTAKDDEAGQLDMLPGLRAAVAGAQAETKARRRRREHDAEPAEVDPVARVLVDVPLPHLDRPFDYVVPAGMADSALPGVRVKVRFAGQDVDGYVLERVAASEHPGRLSPLRRVVSPEPVLSPRIAALTGEIAERYAGARGDVLRLAVPPRHATTEREAPDGGVTAPVRADLPGAQAAWAAHEQAAAFLDHLVRGGAPRAVWQALPGADWPTLVAHAAALCASAGRGVVVCVPHHRDVKRVAAALDVVAGVDSYAVLTADSGPAARYAAFLSVLRGQRLIALGTRSAAFAPVRDLGLVVVWDDGDDLHSEPRAPYPHTREVLLTRADREGAAALVGGFTRTVEAEYLVRTGWAHVVSPGREAVRGGVRVDAFGEEERAMTSRLPGRAAAAMRRALERGPVLVQTPRSGYVPVLACERCRTPARCRACRGPLALGAATEAPHCRWCGSHEAGWRCGECGHSGLRAPVIGRDRTAEELGRLFPGHTVRSSGGDRILESVGPEPALVVATPGAEPVAESGYAGVLVVDVWLSVGRTELRADEEALRRWMNAAGLVMSGGHVVVVGEAALPVVQAFVRWDPAWFAGRELEERVSAHLPPAVRMATVTGPAQVLEEAVSQAQLPAVAEVLGPVAVSGRDDAEPRERLVIRVPRVQGTALSVALGEMQRSRSAHRLPALRVQVDPSTL